MKAFQLSLPGPTEYDPEVLKELYQPNWPHYGDSWMEFYRGVLDRLKQVYQTKGTVYIRPEDHVAIQDMYILTLVDLAAENADYYEYVETTRPEPPCLLPEEIKDRCGDLPYGSLAGE